MPSSARAHTIATSAIEPLVIHILEPLRIQSDPSRRAVVRMPRGVGPEVRLGQPEAADHVAGGHRRQPLLALLLAAVPVDGEHRQRTLHRHHAAQAAVDGLEFLAHHAVGGGRRAAAAVALRCMPSRPSLPKSAASSRTGTSPASNHSAMCGRSRCSPNRRTVLRSSISSGASSESTSSRSSIRAVAVMVHVYTGTRSPRTPLP